MGKSIYAILHGSNLYFYGVWKNHVCTFMVIGRRDAAQERRKSQNWFKLEIFGNDRYLMTCHRER